MNTYNDIKKITIFTKDGVYEIENLSQIEGYGKYAKNRVAKIVSNIINGVGILKFKKNNHEIKIDLTRQIVRAKFE